ncbi:MAG: RES family NAD+ phosphorylase [Acidobacteriota bacterium]
MELETPLTRVRWKDTCRLIPSRYPSTGILDRVARPRDLPLIFELESWTNDRISNELGLLHRIPREEWISGPQATVVMAAYCHPRPDGGRFNGPERGAWYAARKLATAHAEIAYHRTRELAEIGVFETRVQMRLYLSDLSASFHDMRMDGRVRDPNSYTESQELARNLFEAGSNGIVYRSVRHAGGECIACFRPRLVSNVRPDAHFEYRWEGTPTPVVRQL